MIAAFVLACVPDLLTYTPTPVVSWERVSWCSLPSSDPKWAPDCDLGAYRVYRRDWPDTTWRPVEDVPCYWYVDELSEGPLRECKTQHVPQRWTNDELVDADYCVRAVDSAGVESAECSNVVTICLPELWRVGEEAYPNGL